MNNYNSAAVLRKLDDIIAREGAKNVGTEFIKGAEKLKQTKTRVESQAELIKNDGSQIVVVRASNGNHRRAGSRAEEEPPQ